MSLLVLALAALTSQSAQPSVTASVLAAPPGTGFRGGFAENINGIWATEFYLQTSEGQPATWLVRRSLVTVDGREQESWTTDAECPVTKDIADSMGQLQLGTLAIPDTSRSGPRLFISPAPAGPSVPGGSYMLWGKGAAGTTYEINAPGGPIADWARSAHEAIAVCWGV